MELTGIKVEQFKRIKEVDLELADLNILVGANGSGKSSIIQAIHFASTLLRQADRVRPDATSTIAVNEVDYLPSDHYSQLGHDAEWGNKKDTPSSVVRYTYKSDEGEIQEAHCEMRSARNAGISIRGNNPTIFRKKDEFFSAYIPGLSGIPNQEERKSMRVVMKACSHGDSNVYLRNALLLVKDKDGNLAFIEEWLGNIIDNLRINISHDVVRDLVIDAKVSINSREYPIEMVSSGILQLIQIFCYIRLFNPKILLIDEPDIHLHPTVQEQLPELLAKAAKDSGMKILMTTHSPFIVRGAPIDTLVNWVNDGAIKPIGRKATEYALGWGAFGKKVLILSEDADTSFLQKIIRQWPEIDKFVSLIPGRGCRSLPKPDQAKELYDALGGMFKILVHRDRDSLSSSEVEKLRQSYEELGVHLWVTFGSDIESYFCNVALVAKIVACSKEEASGYIQTAINKETANVDASFVSQRKAINSELNSDGSGQSNDEVRAEIKKGPLEGARGKTIFNSLKNVVPSGKYNDVAINDLVFDGNVAIDLKNCLLEFLDK